MKIREIDVQKNSGPVYFGKKYRIIAASKNETIELKDMAIIPEVNCYRTYDIFEKAINECNVLEWEEFYNNMEALDGFSITISIIFEDKTKKNIICMNSYPDKLDRFLEMMDIKI